MNQESTDNYFCLGELGKEVTLEWGLKGTSKMLPGIERGKGILGRGIYRANSKGAWPHVASSGEERALFGMGAGQPVAHAPGI